MSNPYIEIKNHGMNELRNIGYKHVFDYVPDEENSYIMFDAMTNIDTFTKTRTMGQTTLNIQFYDYWDAENNIIIAIDNLIGIYKTKDKTEHYRWNVISSSSNIVNDTSGKVPLKHGTLDITLEYR